MKKLLVVLACMVAIGWGFGQPVLSQTDLGDASHSFQAVSDWNHDGNSHVVPIGAIGVPGTSDAIPFVNFDQLASMQNFNCYSCRAARRKPSPSLMHSRTGR
jgi:hypothetical protein